MDRDTYLVFDKNAAIPFYVREGVDLGVQFHNLEGCLTEPDARKALEKKGFDKNMRLVRV